MTVPDVEAEVTEVKVDTGVDVVFNCRGRSVADVDSVGSVSVGNIRRETLGAGFDDVVCTSADVADESVFLFFGRLSFFVDCLGADGSVEAESTEAEVEGNICRRTLGAGVDVTVSTDFVADDD